MKDPFLRGAEHKKHYLMPLINEALQIKRVNVFFTIISIIWKQKTRNITMDLEKDFSDGSQRSQTGNSFEKSESLGDDLKGTVVLAFSLFYLFLRYRIHRLGLIYYLL